MSDLIVNSKEGINQIKEMQFGIFSSSEIAKISTIECVNYLLYDENNNPIPYSPVDPRLGLNSKKKKEINNKEIKKKVCPTCNKELEYCPGHFGYTRLNLPIFHIGFFKKTIEILQCICKNCSRILLSEEEKNKIRAKALKIKKLSYARTKSLIGGILKLCKNVKICPYCGSLNGKIKQIQGIGPTIIVHDLLKEDLKKFEEKKDEEKSFKRKYESAAILFSKKSQTKSNLSANKVTNKDDLNIFFNNSSSNSISIELTSPYVYNLFSHISPEDYIFFGMDGENSSPLNLLLQYVIVPPLSIRPTVTMNVDGINEDDLTVKIKDIIYGNRFLQSYIQEGNANTYKLMEELNLLQITHAFYINSKTKGINKSILNNSKEIRSLCTRLKGKFGRFRGNLSGKRVDFTGRTVISPDPNLHIDQLGIPVFMAMILTYPERVNKNNMKKLKKMIMNGREKYPGANFWIPKNEENRRYIVYGIREQICKELKVGDIVERHLIDGDIVLFNRQPSLHRVSIMGFHAKILPWRTLRFNESNCTPFNADFDGDEMNIHIPQTEEAKAEANYLMGVVQNIQSPNSGGPLIACTQDFLAVCYLITQKDYFLDRTHFIRYCTYFNDGIEKVEIPPPTILKPKELWTGKQLFSVILKPNKKYKIIINLNIESKSYKGKFIIDKFRCPNDGFVVIRNSELLCGTIDKEAIAKNSKKGIIFALIRDCGFIETAKFLTRVSKFSGRWICDYGMSFGLGDVMPSEDLVKNKEKIIKEKFKENDKEIDLFNNGRIELRPGMNEEESLESSLNKILSNIRLNVGKSLSNILPRSNPALQMAICGSKGDENNLCQMIGCVGQQTLYDKRMPNGFENRSLPHFEQFSIYPESKGFIGHSFYDGMNAFELFFHTMGGRDGLVDKSIKTAETGYMQRRLMKALEDLTVQYNNTVTISNGEIIEFLYGDDGMEPIKTDTENKIIYLPRLWDLICSKYPIQSNNDKILEINEIKEQVEEYITKCPIPNYDLNTVFIEEIRKFFEKKIELIQQSKKSFGNMKQNVINNICSVGQNQLKFFFNEIWSRYIKAKVNPGEAVGAVAGQSIGEPVSQMTLKTFHFAGVASMNITLGVPRIREILNNSQNISTPVIKAQLVQKNDLTTAKIVKGRIEKIKLNRICKYIKEIISPDGCSIEIELDEKYINSSYLEISLEKVREAILNKKKFNSKLKEEHITIKGGKLIIKSPDENRNYLYFVLEKFMKKLPEIVVSGISTVNRVIINKEEENNEKENKEKYYLAVEGKGLLDIMNTDGIDFKNCNSNNIGEIFAILGIEAARHSIIEQLNYTFTEHKIKVDYRHLCLISDLMTFKGTILGFQRHAMTKMKDSVLLHSSFEDTNEILFNSAFFGKVDSLKGVTESIIVGKTVPIGTGSFKLYMDRKKLNEEIKIKKGRMLVEEENDKDDGKDFAKNEIQFNLYDKIK
jgi:DNA-directed RNA polymerase III subunit RPC1